MSMAAIVGLVDAGVLRVEEDGTIWRDAVVTSAGIRQIASRRAESNGRGYRRVTAWVGGVCHSVYAHRLVWVVLVGPIHDGLQINHKDLNKTNNHPSNLEVVTGAENIQHSYANGSPAPWHKAQAWRGRPRRNTAAGVAEAKRMRAGGATLANIAAAMGISVSHAHRMVNA